MLTKFKTLFANITLEKPCFFVVHILVSFQTEQYFERFTTSAALVLFTGFGGVNLRQK
jgi:hypothetical protein